MPDRRIDAPWTAAQVEALNRYQHSGLAHPFTCPRPHDQYNILIATEHGWICPNSRDGGKTMCNYTQRWAHAFMAEDTVLEHLRHQYEEWMMPKALAGPWRVGNHYGVHVYQDDQPVATFFDPALAKEAVKAHNRSIRQSVEEACEVMHDAYEKAAVGAGWETNPQSRKPWSDVPEANKATMRAAVTALMDWLEE